MAIPKRQSIDEITTEIKSISSEWQTSIKEDIEKRLNLITTELRKLIDISNYYKGEIIRLKSDWKKAKEAVSELEGRRQVLIDQDLKLKEKEAELKKREEETADFYEALKKKGESLAERERSLDKKHQVIDERIKHYKVATPIKG